MPEEDQGYILVNALLPDASSLERSDAVMRKVEKILAENEGVAGYNTITGYSLLTSAYSTNLGFFFVELKEWEERHTPELHANGVIAALNKAFAKEIPEAPGCGLRPAGDPGPRNGRGLHHGAAGPRRATRRSTWPSRPSASCEAARKRPEIGRISTLYRAERAAGLRGHRPQQGAEGGRADHRRQHHARLAARQRLRQRLQPVRPRLQGLRPGRARVPQRPEAVRAVLRAQRARARWCRSTRWSARGRRAGPSSRTGSTSTARPRSPGVPAPGFSSAQAHDGA